MTIDRPEKRNDNEQMGELYDDVQLPFEDGQEHRQCAECQRVLPRIPYMSLNRPQRYCGAACCEKGRRRLDRWRRLQGSPR